MFELGSIMVSAIAIVLGTFIAFVLDQFVEIRQKCRYRRNCRTITALVPEFLMMGAVITHRSNNEIFYLFQNNFFAVAHYCIETDPEIQFEFFTDTSADANWSTSDRSAAIARAAHIMSVTKESQTKGA